jgi:hypothetical protein
MNYDVVRPASFNMPIYLDDAILKAGYIIIVREIARKMVLPIEIVIAKKDY